MNDNKLKKKSELKIWLESLIDIFREELKEIINPNKRIEPISINTSAEDEIKKTRLINVIKDGFEQADTLIIDESFNLAGIGGLFIANEIKANEKI
ncbi:unnamed protein product, partial [marine sediment metagenome]